MSFLRYYPVFLIPMLGQAWGWGEELCSSLWAGRGHPEGRSFQVSRTASVKGNGPSSPYDWPLAAALPKARLSNEFQCN
jgi:hypothetical protein